MSHIISTYREINKQKVERRKMDRDIKNKRKDGNKSDEYGLK